MEVVNYIKVEVKVKKKEYARNTAEFEKRF